jgi:hypothetical protein
VSGAQFIYSRLRASRALVLVAGFDETGWGGSGTRTQRGHGGEYKNAEGGVESKALAEDRG